MAEFYTSNMNQDSTIQLMQYMFSSHGTKKAYTETKNFVNV